MQDAGFINFVRGERGSDAQHLSSLEYQLKQDRLDRNRLIVGQLLEEDFVCLGIRYIAIMENIDTAKGVSDIVPMQDPKSAEDKTCWEIDEPAAEVVQKIFQMCVNGLGPTQIAWQLKAEGIPTPSKYLHSQRLNPPTKPPVVPHNWIISTVVHILERQEYVGDTVNFRSCRRSFKLKQRVDRPQENWRIFPNTHPPIIDWETFALVQQLRQHRRRSTKSGIVNIFSGMLYCADCGENCITVAPTITSGNKPISSVLAIATILEFAQPTIFGKM